jgi:hypothetical protein
MVEDRSSDNNNHEEREEYCCLTHLGRRQAETVIIQVSSAFYISGGDLIQTKIANMYQCQKKNEK